MTITPDGTEPLTGEHRTKGRILHSARGYDFLAWLMTFGREPAFREKILDLAGLAPGESVLDVGSGTGTLAIRAKARVGPKGYVCGIDASHGMVTAASRKAKKAGVSVLFQHGVIESLPFDNASFDVVLSTLMMHHLPGPARQAGASQMRRVVKRGGRVVVVDFGASRRERQGLLAHLHRHGHVERDAILGVLRAAGFSIGASGRLGIRDLWFVVATAP